MNTLGELTVNVLEPLVAAIRDTANVFAVPNHVPDHVSTDLRNVSVWLGEQLDGLNMHGWRGLTGLNAPAVWPFADLFPSLVALVETVSWFTPEVTTDQNDNDPMWVHRFESQWRHVWNTVRDDPVANMHPTVQNLRADMTVALWASGLSWAEAVEITAATETT